MQGKTPRSVGVHSGTFHADEVTACALLLLFDLVDRDRIVRTRDAQQLKFCEYVCDVGGVYDPKRKLFDHHQAGYKGDLSSAGMILAYLKDTAVIDAALYRFFNDALIRGVDDHDNGRFHNILGTSTFSHVIANFVPIEQDSGEEVEMQAFLQAVDFCHTYLKRLLERYVYTKRCRQIVEEAMKAGKECLQFDKSIPWQESFFELDGEHHPALFVIMPAGKHWKLRGIPPSIDRRMQVRAPLPQEWAGLLDADLQRVSGINGAIFCHKGRFISVWQTRLDAMHALDYVLKKRGRRESGK